MPCCIDSSKQRGPAFGVVIGMIGEGGTYQESRERSIHERDTSPGAALTRYDGAARQSRSFERRNLPNSGGPAVRVRLQIVTGGP